MNQQDKKTLREFSILTEKDDWNEELLEVVESLRSIYKGNDGSVNQWLSTPTFTGRSPREMIADGDVETILEIIYNWENGVFG